MLSTMRHSRVGFRAIDSAQNRQYDTLRDKSEVETQTQTELFHCLLLIKHLFFSLAKSKAQN